MNFIQVELRGNSKNREFATREEVLKRVEEKGAKLVITQSGKK